MLKVRDNELEVGVPSSEAESDEAAVLSSEAACDVTAGHLSESTNDEAAVQSNEAASDEGSELSSDCTEVAEDEKDLLLQLGRQYWFYVMNFACVFLCSAQPPTSCRHLICWSMILIFFDLLYLSLLFMFVIFVSLNLVYWKKKLGPFLIIYTVFVFFDKN